MKILVVDDEHLINRYIVQCIRSAGDGSDVTSALSGERALHVLAENAVDLAFVDITMPKMDGLTLLREIKSRYSAVSVVMLTCHSEFEYARAAMHSGADNYVLKSELTPESMSRVLADVQDARRKRNMDQMTSLLLQRDYLKKITAAGSDVRVVTEEGLRKNSILLRDDAFLALCFRNTSRNLNTVVAASGAEFENPLLYAYDDHLFILLLNIRRTSRRWDTFDALFREMDRRFDRLEAHMDGHIGCSRVCFRMARLHAAIAEALESLNDKFYGSPVPADVPADVPAYAQRTEQLRGLLMRAAVRLEEENLGACCRALDELTDFARRLHPDASTLLEGLESLCRSAAGRYPLPDRCGAALQSAGDFSALLAAVVSLQEALSGMRNGLSAPIRRAVDFIDQHFAEDITLNAVADHVFLNREHLSRQFKKEVGMNFSEYLTQIRLRRAKELLETTSLRISDVAEQVGIPSISYFSTVFRREFGSSPSSIRSGRGEEV